MNLNDIVFERQTYESYIIINKGETMNKETAYKIYLENLLMYETYFKEHNVNFKLRDIYRTQANVDNDGEFIFIFYFSVEGNKPWNPIAVEIIFDSKNNAAILNKLKLNFPSNTLSKDEINLEKIISYHENVKNLLLVLNNMDQLLPYLQNYKTVENTKTTEKREELELKLNQLYDQFVEIIRNY